MIGRVVQNYSILSKIGEGGMGYVYLGEHITLHRKAAIKFLNPVFAKDIEVKKRFLNEGYTLAQLNHNNIVALYDFADLGDELFLVLEYVEGHPLDHFIERVNGPIHENLTLTIFKQILSGFSFAHSKGVIHRDIKPSNIILKPDYTPKILDFGIAKMLTSNRALTKAGDKVGTVLYMSPEQVRGNDVDIRSDIYSLGITLFEMLTGKRVYDLNTLSDYTIQTKIISEPLPLASDIYPAVSRHMENVIATATSKLPEERFQTCEEFALAMDDVYFKSNIKREYVNPFNPAEEIQPGQNYAQVEEKDSWQKDIEGFKKEVQKNSFPEKSPIPRINSQKTEIYRAKPKEESKKGSYSAIFISAGFIIFAALVWFIISLNNNKIVEIPKTETKKDSLNTKEVKKEIEPVSEEKVEQKQIEKAPNNYYKKRNTTGSSNTGNNNVSPPPVQKPRKNVTFE